jgi:transcriptional regulator with XRE-family HTH domain
MDKTIHEGRNVKRIREMLGIKQDALAIELGDDWNQKKTSLLEGKETIEPQILDEVAKALKVPVVRFDVQSIVALHKLQRLSLRQ